MPDIKSLRRAVSVLDLFFHEGRELSFTEVATSLGLSKATAHRFLAELCELGFLRRTEGNGTFALGLRLIELGAAAADRVVHRDAIRPFLRGLAALSEETSNLAVVVGTDVVVVDQVESPHEFRMYARVGKNVPPASSSLGKAILAFAGPETRERIVDAAGLSPRTPASIVSRPELENELERVRSLGHAVDDEENRPGVRCVGAPVRDFTGRTIGAVSISGPSVRLTADRVAELGPAVRDAALDASRALGYRELVPAVEG